MKYKIFLLLFLTLFCFLFRDSYAASIETPEIKAGLQQYYARDFAKALESFNAALEKDPKNSLAIMYVCDCHKRQKDISKYLTDLEEQSLAKPNDSMIKTYLGFAYFTQSITNRDDLFQESINMFQEALKLDSNNSLAYTGMGTVYYQKRLIPRAKSYFSKAYSLNSYDSMAMERLGDIYMNDDKSNARALNMFTQIIELYPSYPDAYFFSGSANERLGNNEKALEFFARASGLDPLGLTTGYYAPIRIGDIYFRNKDYPNAITYYEAALKINRDNPYAQKMYDKCKELEGKKSDKKK